MNWRRKAAVQNLVSRLPASLSYTLYYAIQRNCGGLRRPTPISRLKAGVAMARRIQECGHTVEAMRFLEIGTGRHLNLPLALWLCGADEIITVDLNPYLKTRLVLDDLAYLRDHQAEIRQLFAPLSPARLLDQRLEKLTRPDVTLEALLSLAHIRYLAPADARALKLPPASVDYHISYTVLEHIPPASLQDILREGQRLLRPGGLLVHCIDFSDHFAHSDSTISTINFLQFSEPQWEHLAGNRYMYHNRLRVDEFCALLNRLPLKILSLETEVDAQAQGILEVGFPLDARFRAKNPTTNATSQAWVVAAPESPTPSRSGSNGR